MEALEPLFFSEDPQFWYETLRALGHTAYGGADIGEVLATAQRITAGDYDSWYGEWLATADAISAEAESASKAGHDVSAHDGWLRASNYYRTAEFFLHGNPADPRIDHVYYRSVDSFRAAAALGPTSIEPVEIPYESTVLHGYFYRGAGSSENATRPTIILHSGFDGSAEEMHFHGAAAGAERGYHMLSFDGPGMPAARHRDGLVFRPDWENVVGPVVDWLLGVPGVDVGRVGLMGYSMGGLLAPRAAAFEHRLSACVAVDGVFDLGSAALARMPNQNRDDVERLLRSDHAPEVDAALEKAMDNNSTLRWMMSNGCYVMGAKTPREFLARWFDYTLDGGIAEQVACPTLVCDAEDDMFFAGQPDQLYDHLTALKTMMRFTNAEGSGAHCHTGAERLANARIFDWLDENLA